MIREKFVEVVTKTGMATLKEVRQITKSSKNPNWVDEVQLLDLPHFDEIKFAKIVSEKYAIQYMDLSKAKVTKECLEFLRKKFVVKFRAVPVQIVGNKVTFAIYDPTVIEYKKQLIDMVKKNVDFILTHISAWKSIFENVRDSVDDLATQVSEVKASNLDDEEVKAEDIGEDVITFVNKILAQAFVEKVSDIHFEPYEKTFRVRFRMDGSLIINATPPRSMLAPVVSRLKIMADMDISEKRKPQDGRIKLIIAGDKIDYRVSSMPTLFGEKIVLRLLDQSNLQLDMTKLGFGEKQLAVFKEAIHKPYGMCLVTGPTGSGKTTTLYSAMMELNTPQTNISTAEDPVEFNLEGVNQVNIKKDIGLTFPVALKAFLRQDPDIILVGEIRDLEVGEIAVEAALTGHLVFATLHTNDAPATITRLLNMGIEPFLVVSALNVVVAQRLCRRICTKCRAPIEVSHKELIKAGFSPGSAQKVKVFKGAGCDDCNNSGYKGRVAIHEVMIMTPKVKDIILENGSADELKLQAIKDGMKTLRMAALTKVAQGMTTIEEALGNSAADEF